MTVLRAQTIEVHERRQPIVQLARDAVRDRELEEDRVWVVRVIELCLETRDERARIIGGRRVGAHRIAH
ncbi:MAG: hypothetical protein R3E12_13685 [Candidatus Eisenbacteria bacterium]